MIEYLILLLAFPLGYLCAKTTLDEKSIYTKQIYFPTLIKILAIVAAISFSQNQQIFLTSTFLLITIHTWHKATYTTKNFLTQKFNINL